MGDRKTLLTIITEDMRAAGHPGELSQEDIARWREQNPIYAKWPLWTAYSSGSAVPVRGRDKLDRATVAWVASGRPSPSSPAFDHAAFDEYMAAYLDEYDDAYYPATAPKGAKRPR